MTRHDHRRRAVTAAQRTRRRRGHRLGSLAGYRWPLAPLLARCRLTPSGFARAHGLAATTVCRAARVGLNDQQADHWALWVGSHPACVWGWPWVEAGLRLDPQKEANR